MQRHFVYSLGDFLLFYFAQEVALLKPINLIVNGNALTRPFVAIPLDGLKRAFIITRKPKRLRNRNFDFTISDASGQHIQWRQQTLNSSQSTDILTTEWLKLFSTLERHLENQFGQVPAKTWQTLATSISRCIPKYRHVLPDGRCYWRIKLDIISATDLSSAIIRAPGDSCELRKTAILLESEWLHLITPKAIKNGPPLDSLIISILPNWILPISIADGIDLPTTALGPIEDIVCDYSGNRDILRQFLLSVARIKSPLDRETRLFLKALKTEISGLCRGVLTGLVVDTRNQSSNIEVGIKIDGMYALKTTADLPNPRDSAGNHGFSCVLGDNLLDGSRHAIQLCLPDRPDISLGSEYLIGKGYFDSHVHISAHGEIKGWVRERCNSVDDFEIALIVDEVSAAISSVARDLATDKCKFSFVLPHVTQDGKPHQIAVAVSRHGHQIATIGNALTYQAKYRGQILKSDLTALVGWILNESRPNDPVILDLHVNDTKYFTSETVPFIDANGKKLYGFSFNLTQLDASKSVHIISLRIAGTQTEVLGPKRIITPQSTILQGLNHMCALLRSQVPDPSQTEWIRRQILLPLIRSFRKSASIPPTFTLELSPIIQWAGYRKATSKIDVVIPVYAGLAESLECIESLQGKSETLQYEIVVINDFSPDPKLTERLRSLATEGKITLLENPKNLGFVASANRGLKLHPDRDVVLLNSDTVMPAEGIDRMRRVAYSNQAIGTVTPFSNNATICSFPQFNADNVIPEGWDLSSLDAELAKTNGDRYVDIPTAVGFCMYIKRQVIDEIGLLDEQQWGKGYGEENDFCLRASTLGWRHVLAAGVFVQHHGSVSFGSDKSGLLATNLGKLNRLYPDYAPTIQQFLQTDPIAPYRNPVVIKLMREVSDRFMLYVSHSLGGGTQVATDDLAANLARENIRILELRSCRGDKWELKLHGTPYLLAYRANDWDTLLADLKLLNVWHVHFHQIPFFSKAITELGDRLGVPYDVTIHDYLPICPRINMLDETGWYCGDSQFDADTCNRCVRALGTDEGVEPLFAEHGNDVAKWRAHFGSFLKKARRVTAPSSAALAIINRHFKLGNSIALPHREAPFRISHIQGNPGQTIHVAVIGAIGRHKGFDILLSCARSALKDGLPLRFVVIGFTHDDASLQSLDNVIITGRYERNDLPSLLTKYGCRIAAFLSPWPETYCYALTEAWRSGLYAVAFDLGAQAERIREAGFGEILPAYSSHPKQINRALLDAARRAETAVPPPGDIGLEYGSVLADYYALASKTKPKAQRKRPK
jgi:GT2 family glycosyltransferase